MIIDVHTHCGKAEHFGMESMQESLLAKDQKLSEKELRDSHNIDPDKYMQAMKEGEVDKSAVMGMDLTRFTDTKVPNSYLRDFVSSHPDKLMGFPSFEPLDARGRLKRETLTEFERCIVEWGLKGLKLLPTYSRYYPNDRAVYPLYEKAQELGVPILMHLSGTSHTFSSLKCSNPVFLEDVVADFPDLKISVAHMGYPSTEELLVLMRKHRSLYTDIAALFGRPTILTWNLVMAKEYGVIGRVMLGTDYPLASNPKFAVDWCKTKLNDNANRSGWPTLTSAEIDGLLGGNAQKYLGI